MQQTAAARAVISLPYLLFGRIKKARPKNIERASEEDVMKIYTIPELISGFAFIF
jgi:hypothetical protein